MRIIIIEEKVYRVTNKECEKLQEMQRNDNSDHENTMNYLDDAKKNYKCLGAIFFDCRR